jgi:hypothetical protein
MRGPAAGVRDAGSLGGGIRSWALSGTVWPCMRACHELQASAAELVSGASSSFQWPAGSEFRILYTSYMANLGNANG